MFVNACTGEANGVGPGRIIVASGAGGADDGADTGGGMLTSKAGRIGLDDATVALAARDMGVYMPLGAIIEAGWLAA